MPLHAHDNRPTTTGNRRSDYARKRLLVEYWRATRNEIAIDLQAASYAGTSPDAIGYIPRPGLWMGKNRAGPALSRRLAWLLATAWRMSRGLPFHAIKTLQLARHWRTVRDQHLPDGEARFGLAFSRRAMEVISPLSLANPPTCWIVSPWVDTNGLDSGRTLVDALALLRPADLRDALALAVAATRAMAMRPLGDRWILQSYTAVPWFLIRLALTKLQGDLYMAEHFDRWAVLADGLVRHARLRENSDGAREVTQLTLVQHGVVASLAGGDSDGIVLPRRLGAIETLYVYDERSEQIFRRQLLTAACRTQVVVHQFQPMIALQDSPSQVSKSILFVGHPLCAQLHVAVYKALLTKTHIRAYYKPHPAAGTAEICKAQSWIMLHNQSGFPRVDILLAYPSTLVKEYAVHNIEAIVHPLNAGIEDAEHIARQILQSLT